MNLLLPCPSVGHRSFEKSLRNITIGNAETPTQISKFIRPHSCTQDDLNIQYQPGELQKMDYHIAMSMFSYPNFVASTFRSKSELFRHSQCRIYQFQTILESNNPFIFGLFITDGSHNLIDFCLDSKQQHKRRSVLIRLIRAICTPESLAKKISLN